MGRGREERTPDVRLSPGLTSGSSGSLFKNICAQDPPPESRWDELGRGPGMGLFKLPRVSDVQVVLRGWHQSRRRRTVLRWAAWGGLALPTGHAMEEKGELG